jgi:putative spermidine/putrescine transport system permease protein
MLKRIPPYWILMAPGLLIFFLIFIIPVARLAMLSFRENTPSGIAEAGFVWDHYVKFFTDPYYLGILGRTLTLSLIVSLICLVLGYSLAYGASRAKDNRKIILLMLIALPLLTSATIRNFGWIIIMGRNGLINQTLMGLGIIGEPLKLLYTETGVVIALVHVLLPYMVLILFSVLDGLDRNLESAAANLGASRPKVFFLVTLPLSMPGIVAGTLLVFSISISFFVTPSLIGGPKVQLMATEIYNQTINLLNWPFASALSMILLVTVLIVTTLYNRALSRSRTGGARLI